MPGIHAAQLIPGSRKEKTTSRGAVAKRKGNRHPLAVADNIEIIPVGMIMAFHARIMPTAGTHFYRRKSAYAQPNGSNRVTRLNRNTD